jgi:Proline racemase
LSVTAGAPRRLDLEQDPDLVGLDELVHGEALHHRALVRLARGLMSGGNTIAVAAVLLETGMIPMQEPVTGFTLEARLIAIRAECRDGKVKQVTFENVPAFCVYRDAVVDVPELGEVTVDVAWAGCSTSSRM